MFEDELKPRGGMSFVSGPADQPIWEKTIPQTLREAVHLHGSAPAAIFHESGIRWSYNDLDQVSRDMAAGLLSLGIERGDRVGIWSPNRWEWVALQFATARIRAVLVTINPAYRKAEVEYVLNKTGTKALVLAPQFKTSDYIAMIADLVPELKKSTPGNLRCTRLPALRSCIRMGEDDTPGMMNIADLMGRADDTLRAHADEISLMLSPADPINIQFTSGTTGAPKGATLTHRNIVNNARFTIDRMRLQAGEGLCIPVPLYHCFGMVMGSLASVTKGAFMVFPAEGFDPLMTLRAVSEERCSALYSVPTMFLAMLDHPEFSGFDLSCLRTGIMAGAPCPMEVMRRVMGEMNLKEITIAYGMTETSPVSFQSHPDDPIELRVSTVGRIHPHTTVRIVDENGRIVPIGQKGELQTLGYSVMQGYWGEDEQTAAAIDAEGWMHTGDLATLDENGFCRIVGRVKDMVIRGGENIYPREVEEFLYAHPSIQQVQVFGVPDPKYGEELCAYIILHDGKDEDAASIRTWCEGQIAHYKIPRHIRFRQSLPMTVTGKPQKFVMRAEMIRELKLEEYEGITSTG